MTHAPVCKLFDRISPQNTVSYQVFCRFSGCHLYSPPHRHALHNMKVVGKARLYPQLTEKNFKGGEKSQEDRFIIPNLIYEFKLFLEAAG